MPAIVDAAKLLRAGVLEGVTVLVAGAADQRAAAARPAFAAHVASTCAALGARVRTCSDDAAEAGEVAQVGELGESGAPDGVDRLVVDGAALFEAGALAAVTRADGVAAGREEIARAALRECLDGAWLISHAVANAAFLAARRPGRIVYIAPASAHDADADWLADAARAGLENLARTLSIEWARYDVVTAAIAPGAGTSGEHVATLCAYLCSPAGAYFSGCMLDLRGTRAHGGAR
jgi:NAD(P)-dependent dehydrogenase (short-subunit alcohol dehydrogenase family)